MVQITKKKTGRNTLCVLIILNIQFRIWTAHRHLPNKPSVFFFFSTVFALEDFFFSFYINKIEDDEKKYLFIYPPFEDPLHQVFFFD
jgi:hypothetical protein